MVAPDLPLRPENTLTEEQQKEIEKLRALGYVAGVVKAPEVTGVTSHVEGRAFAGLNLYTSGHGPEAILMDMDGTVLHSWRREFSQLWPDETVSRVKPVARYWRRAYLFENGDLIAIHEGLGIVKLNRNSEIIWTLLINAHHDLDVAPDGTIFVLTRQAKIVPHIDVDNPVLEDFVTLLDPNGQKIESHSLLEILEDSSSSVSWTRASERFWSNPRKSEIAGFRGSIFHTNSLEILNNEYLAKAVPAFAEGRLLLSMRNLEMIVVIDIEQDRVVWSLENRFGLQHDPNITRNGMLMVFDNIWRPGRSRVAVFDPRTQDVSWQYVGSPDHPFFSETRGVAQRLPNLNILITESESGRAFEVTPNSEIVWEYLNPHRAVDSPEKIAVINEMERLPLSILTKWSPTEESRQNH